ncbi:hypothetical protein BaRGS_00006756 [Batillaria attramentaria]|uniref:Secreted protein n=1 Tax=Batillaria attramentaria TaxID=370345 RepID=A0ABD0LR26_9CAEN
MCGTFSFFILRLQTFGYFVPCVNGHILTQIVVFITDIAEMCGTFSNFSVPSLQMAGCFVPPCRNGHILTQSVVFITDTVGMCGPTGYFVPNP